jgi:hypothetical protein
METFTRFHGEIAFGLSPSLVSCFSHLISGVCLSAERPFRVAICPCGALSALGGSRCRDFQKHGLPVRLVAVGSSTRNRRDGFRRPRYLGGSGTAGITAQLQGYTDMALFANFIRLFVLPSWSSPR